MPHAVPASRQPAGILAPVVTTFDASERLDLDAFATNLRAHLVAGLDGVVVAGSTGEAALLDDEERVRLVAMARDVVPDDRWLVVGVGAESTRATVRRCEAAHTEGADAVLVVAPHYYGSAMTPAALRAHYQRVADESPCPVLLYNIPKYMHFALPADLVAELAAHGNVIGLKDSSGDLAMLGGFLQAQSDTFSVLTGHAGTFHDAWKLGARGGILAAALFAPELARAVLDRAGVADDAAAEAQQRLLPLGRDVVGTMGVAGVKAALDAVGLRGGPLRLPLLPLDDEGTERVRRLLADAGVGATAGMGATAGV